MREAGERRAVVDARTDADGRVRLASALAEGRYVIEVWRGDKTWRTAYEAKAGVAAADGIVVALSDAEATGPGAAPQRRLAAARGEYRPKPSAN